MRMVRKDNSFWINILGSLGRLKNLLQNLHKNHKLFNSSRTNAQRLMFCMTKYLFMLDFRTKFLNSNKVSWNCHWVCILSQGFVKLNGHLFTKLLGCQYRLFMIHNKTDNCNFYSTAIKIPKYVALSKNLIVVEKIIFLNFQISWIVFKRKYKK